MTKRKSTPAVSLVKDSADYIDAMIDRLRTRILNEQADRYFYGTLDWATKTEILAGLPALVRVP